MANFKYINTKYNVIPNVTGFVLKFYDYTKNILLSTCKENS